MAVFTWPAEGDLTAFLTSYGIEKYDGFRAIEGGSVNSNFRIDTGASYFLRLYEEQDAAGAAAEMTLVRALAKGGVATPAPLEGVHTLAGRPAALFPWVTGVCRCQKGVRVEDAAKVGEALARLHVTSTALKAREGRFDAVGLRLRLERIPAASFPVERLRHTLSDLVEGRDPTIPKGLIHGDLFRDNVLWEGDRLAALLDFESACEGAFVYDLAVTLLAWCYGDDFSPSLCRALVRGYESVRPLERAEREALHTEARLAAVRFTVTRITDYAMRTHGAGVMKDWRRFLARLDAIEAMGEGGLVSLIE